MAHLIFRACALAGTLVGTGAAMAQTNVQIYGRMNVSLERVSSSTMEDGAEQWRVSNNRSVLGFRGSEELGRGVKAIFQIEGTVSPDTGEGGLAQRDTRVGLDGDFGTIFLGHWGTAFVGATSVLDPFYPTTAGMSSIIGNGSAPSTNNVENVASFDRRQANSVHYWSRPIDHFSLRITHGVSEERPANGAKPSLTAVAGIYEKGPWYVTVAHEHHEEYQGPNSNDTGTRIGAAYNFGSTRIAALAERLKFGLPGGDLERDAYLVSLTHQVGPHGLRASVLHARDAKGPVGARIGTTTSGPDSGARQATVGYEYSLSKRTTAYAYYTYLNNDRRAVRNFAINGLSAAPGAILRASMFGLRHIF